MLGCVGNSGLLIPNASECEPSKFDNDLFNAIFLKFTDRTVKTGVFSGEDAVEFVPCDRLRLKFELVVLWLKLGLSYEMVCDLTIAFCLFMSFLMAKITAM